MAINSSEAVGVIESLDGFLVVFRDDGSEAELQQGDSVYMNDQVFTEGNSTAVIRFNDGSTVDVADDSSVFIDEYVFQAQSMPSESVVAIPAPESSAEPVASALSTNLPPVAEPSVASMMYGEPAGLIESMTGDAVVVRVDGAQVSLQQGDFVYTDDQIFTESDAAVSVRFTDETSFSIGADSTLVIDAYAYEPSTGVGAVDVSVLKGLFVFISGLVADKSPESMTIKTPGTTIGIRGTEGMGKVGVDGEESYYVNTDGIITITTSSGTVVIDEINETAVVLSPALPPQMAKNWSSEQVIQTFISALRVAPISVTQRVVNADVSLGSNVRAVLNRAIKAAKAQQKDLKQDADDGRGNGEGDGTKAKDQSDLSRNPDEQSQADDTVPSRDGVIKVVTLSLVFDESEAEQQAPLLEQPKTVDELLDRVEVNLRQTVADAEVQALADTVPLEPLRDDQTEARENIDTPQSVEVAGLAVDSYIANATVFFDVNGNGTLDAGEVSTVTDASGNFSLQVPLGVTGSLVVLAGGTDLATGEVLDVNLSAPVNTGSGNINSLVVSPLSSLVDALINSGMTEANALARASQLAGVDNDILTTDPVALALSGNANGVALLQANVATHAVVAMMANAIAGASDGQVSVAEASAAVFAAIADNPGVLSGSGTTNFAAVIQQAATATGTSINVSDSAALSGLINIVLESTDVSNSPGLNTTEQITRLAQISDLLQNGLAGDIQQSFNSGQFQDDFSDELTSGSIDARIAQITPSDLGVLDPNNTNLNFTTTNLSPSLSVNTIQLETILADTAAPSIDDGVLVSSLIASVHGADGDNGVKGIAIEQFGAAGTWFVSTDNGQSWSSHSLLNGQALLLDANARVYFQPNEGVSGADVSQLSFRIWDGSLGQSGQVLTLPATGGDSAFSQDTASAEISVFANVLVTTPITIIEGQSTLVTVAAIDSRVVPNTSAVQFDVSQVVGGQFVEVSGEGVLTQFTLADVINGNIRFVHDGSEIAASFSVAMHFNGLVSPSVPASINFITVNDAPNAVADSAVVGASQPAINLDVLANDSDAEAGLLTISGLDTTGTQGVVSINAGMINYNPNGEFTALAQGESANDTFGYTITDSDGATSNAVVTVQVIGENDAPVALDDTLTIAEDAGDTLVNVLANDSDVDNGDTFTIKSIDTTNTQGSVSLVAGVLRYNPNGQFDGLNNGQVAGDRFTYTIEDSHGELSTATVTISIEGFNDDLTEAHDDTYSVDEDGTLTVTSSNSVLQNDTPSSSVTVSTTPISNTAHGTLTLNSDGTFLYQPDANFVGSDRFVYEMSDGSGGVAQATVTINVAAINDAPILANTHVLTPLSDTAGHPFEATQSRGASISPDGRYLVSVGNDTNTHFVNIYIFNDSTQAYEFSAVQPLGNNVYANALVSVDFVDDESGGVYVRIVQRDTYTADVFQLVDTPDGVELQYAQSHYGDLFSIIIDDKGTNAWRLFDYDQVTRQTSGDNLQSFRLAYADGNEIRLGFEGEDHFYTTQIINSDNTPEFSGSDSIAFSDDGNLLFVSNDESADIVVYLDSDNGFVYHTTWVAGVDIPAMGASQRLHASADGTQLYIVSQSTVAGAPAVLYTFDLIASTNNGTEGQLRLADSLELRDANGVAIENVAQVLIDGVDSVSIVANDGRILSFERQFDSVASVDEDSGAPVNGVTQGSVITDFVVGNDVDGDALGIAVGDVEGAGFWYYSIDDGASWQLIADETDGILLLASSARVYYQPGPDEAGDAVGRLLYLLWDGTQGNNGELVNDPAAFGGESAFGDTIGSLFAGVNPVNDEPFLTHSALIVTEGQDIYLSASDLQAEDIDNSRDVVSFTLTALPSHGLLSRWDGSNDVALAIGDSFTQSDIVDGLIRYQHDGSETTSDSLSFNLSDGTDTSAVQSLLIAVTPINDAPSSVDVMPLPVDEGYAVLISAAHLQTNDSDTPPEQLIYRVTGTPSSGSLRREDGVNPPTDIFYNDSFSQADIDAGFIRYQHNGTNTLEDQISLSLSDGNASIAVNLAVEVTPQEDQFYGREDVTLYGNLDFDFLATNNEILDRNTLVVDLASVTSPANGVVSVNADGSFSYTANANYNGPDSFDYDLVDGSGNRVSSTATLFLDPVNDAPDGVDDHFTVVEDTSLAIDLSQSILNNDTDLEGGVLHVALFSGPNHGRVSLLENGRFLYVPDDDYSGGDYFRYSVTDSEGDSSLAYAFIEVLPTNDAPNARDDFYRINESNSVSENLYDNDGDLESSIQINTTPISSVSHGDLTIFGSGFFSYTPDPDFVGIDTFTYEIQDAEGLTDTATVTIEVFPAGTPISAADTYFVNENDNLVVTPANGVLVNDSDPEAEPLAVALTPVTNPNNGTVVLAADGSFIYTPNLGFSGDDSFEYSVTDGVNSQTGEVFITVYDRSFTPVAQIDNYVAQANTALVVNAASGVLANDSDADGDALALSYISAYSAHGQIVYQDDGSFVYQPNADFVGVDHYEYVVREVDSYRSDGSDIYIVVNPHVAGNDAPLAADSHYTISEDSTIVVTDPALGLLAGASDADGDALMVNETVEAPLHGDLSVNADGTFSYTPHEDFFGQDSFVYVVADSQGQMALATVHIDVSSVNDAPEAFGASANLSEGSLASAYLTIQDTDPDSDFDYSVVTTTSHGSLTLYSYGYYSYTPDSGFTGTDSFTYQITDDGGLTAQATVVLNVLPSGAPVSVDDNYNVNENSSLVAGNDGYPYGLLHNDTISGDISSVSASVATPAANGVVTLFADGSFEYSPNTGFVGQDSFEYAVTDGVSTSTSTVFITVNDIAINPEANEDSYSTLANQPLIVNAALGVLANDTDVEGDAIEVGYHQAPQHGELILLDDGSFAYLPNEGFIGIDSFRYQVIDATGRSSSYSNVNIIINPDVPGNSAPTAADENYVIDEDNVLAVGIGTGLLANDSDADSDAITVAPELWQEPQHGVVDILADGSFTYTPNADFFGTDAFSYIVLDSNGLQSLARATVTVNPVNDLPNAEDDQFFVYQDNNVSGHVDYNDSDPEAALDVNPVPVSTPAHGTVTLYSNGYFIYTPGEGFVGQDSFIYEVIDSDGATSQATVHLNVVATGTPRANDDNYNLAEGDTLVIGSQGLLNNDYDPDSDPLQINPVAVSGPSNGVLTLNTDGSFAYTPNASFVGTDSFVYEVSDGSLSSQATVSITVYNQNFAPEAGFDSYNVSVNTALEVDASTGLLSNDSDRDGDPLTVAYIVNAPDFGEALVNDDGSFVYVPDPGFTGVDSLRYRVTEDNGFNGDTGEAIFIVNPDVAGNSAPIATHDEYNINEDSSLSGVAGVNGLLDNDSDADSDTLSVRPALFSEPQNGTVTVSADGSFTYTPNTNFFGVDEFVYIVEDSHGQIALAQATINVSSVNDAPEANDSFYTVTQGQTAASYLSYSVNDVETPDYALLFTTTPITSPAHGELSLYEGGYFNYQPNPDFIGTDSFVYEVTDADGATTQATVFIDIRDPDAPDANADTYYALENQVLLIEPSRSLLNNDFDPNNQNLTVTTSPVSPSLHGSVAINADGTFEYTPNQGFNGQDSFSYSVSNGSFSSEAIVTINVSAHNTSPTAVDDSYSVSEDTVLTTVVGLDDVLLNDSDLDGDTLSVIPRSNTSTNGVFVINADGSFSYTPNANFEGVDTHYYTVIDGEGGVSSASVDIHVSGIDDAPTANDDNYIVIEGQSLSAIDLRFNDYDPEDGWYGYLLIDPTPVTGPANGRLVLDQFGRFEYIPDSGFTGTDTFVYEITDTDGLSSQATVTINVLATDALLAHDDTFFVAENGSFTGDVSVNDLDVDRGGFNVNTTPVVDVSHGSLTIDSDGRFEYTPDANFVGQDTFSYQIIDGSQVSTAQVTLSVYDTEARPESEHDVYVVNENDHLIVLPISGLLANDSDIDGGDLTVNLASSLQFGELALSEQYGSFIYRPDPDFTGIDQFTYYARDERGASSNHSTVFVVVNPVTSGTAPVAGDDYYTLNEDTNLSVVVGVNGLLDNDSDADLDSLTLLNEALLAPEHGSISLNSDGSFSYTPEANFHGQDSFFYGVQDSSGQYAVGRAFITVTSINDAPEASDDHYHVQAGSAIELWDMRYNDVDPDNDYYYINTLSLNPVPVSPPSNGIITLNSLGEFVYTPNSGFEGSDSFVYEVSDADGATSQATVTIDVVAPGAPIAHDDVYSVAENGNLFIYPQGLLSNDIDTNGDPLQVNNSPVIAPTHGSLILNPDGSFSYEPDAGFVGTDSFSYEVSDGQLTSQATVEINVYDRAFSPTGIADIYSVTAGELIYIPAASGLLVNDTDPDGDSIYLAYSYNIAGYRDGSFIYGAETDVAGIDVLNYYPVDSTGRTGNQTDVYVVVNPDIADNDAPIVGHDSYTIMEDGVLTTQVGIDDVLLNDSDIDGDSLFIETSPFMHMQPQHGDLVLNSDGSFSYTPHADFDGTDSFGYIVNDGQGHIALGVVDIVVMPHNDSPDAQADSYSFYEGDTVFSANVLQNDFDPDSELLSVAATPAIAPLHGTLVLNDNGTFFYQPEPGFVGSDSFSYTVSDGHSAVTASVSLNILPQGAPRANNDSYAVTQGGTLNFGVESGLLANDDYNGNRANLSVTAATAMFGALLVNADGSFSYEADPAFSGLETFSYVLSDGVNTSQGQVTIRVYDTDLQPEAVDDAYELNENSVLVIDLASGVLINDIEFDGDTLGVAYQSQYPSHGSVILNNDGSFVYVPDAGFSGTDSFAYVVRDEQNLYGNEAVVTLTIHPENEAPEFSGAIDFVDTFKNATAPINGEGHHVQWLLADAFDGDGDPVGIAITSFSVGTGTWFYSTDGGASYQMAPTLGADETLYLAADALLYYQPGLNEVGTDVASISFAAWDATEGHDSGTTAAQGVFGGEGSLSSHVATASIDVVENSAPVMAIAVDPVFLSGAPASLFNFNTAYDPLIFDAELAALGDKGNYTGASILIDGSSGILDFNGANATTVSVLSPTEITENGSTIATIEQVGTDYLVSFVSNNGQYADQAQAEEIVSLIEFELTGGSNAVVNFSVDDGISGAGDSNNHNGSVDVMAAVV